MRIILVLFLAIAAPVAAVADALCEELWLTRNTVFDRAGYCFGSDLGKAVFDNSDCTTTAPDLSAENEAIIAQVRGVEADFNCGIDTTRKALKLDHVITRRVLDDLPVNTGYESMCIGYNGPALLLTAGRHPDTTFTGEILSGMNVMFNYYPVDEMEFVDLGDGQMGWVNAGLITPGTCTSWAG